MECRRLSNPFPVPDTSSVGGLPCCPSEVCVASPPVYFPTGMTTIDVVLYFGDPTGRPASGHGRVIAERKFGYVGTSWTSDTIGKWLPSKLGYLTLTVPVSDQAGLTGDKGQAILNVGYQFQFQPLHSAIIDTLKTVLLPASLGASVPLAQIADLGGWPNATIYQTGPITPTDPTTPTQYVETPAGSGIFRKV